MRHGFATVKIGFPLPKSGNAARTASWERIMDITLVTASNSKEVHGTDNDKKTGCGINLLRGENITVYRRIGRMTDLKEITCEKCKASLAKKMIKADKKEMSRMLKEEKQRAKMGMGDEGIVPLGNTTARITSAPRTYNSPAPQQRNNAPMGGGYGAPNNGYNAPEPQMQNDPAPAQPAAPQNTIPGTGVAIDDSLAAFAINKPVSEPENTFDQPAAPAPAAPQAPQDDFMTQFAFQKPMEEQPAAPAQDDFLAQFAVPSSEQPVQNSYDTYQPEPAPAAPPVIDNVDDILSMFSVDKVASQGVPSGGTNPYSAAPSQPAYNAVPQQPVYGTPAQPAYGTSQPAMGGMNDWDNTANNLYGAAPQQPAVPAFDDLSAPAQQPYFNDVTAQNTPVFEDLASPAQNTAPVFNDITSDIPSINDIPAVPGIDEIPSIPSFDAEPAEKVNLAKEDYMDNNNTFNSAPAPAPQASQPQIITVPQLAGYDQSGQPVYNYVQMQMTGLDPNGQPIFTPVNNQPAQQAKPAPAPAPQAARPAAPYTGAPKANVSKIAVNPHAKQTSQAFIRAIASSKEYADKNLIDTQGLVANTPILSSIEDVLSTMGDDSAKQQMLAKQQQAQQQEKTVTSFSEYKGPNGGMNNRRPVPPQFRNTPSQQQTKDPRMMTKSELKAYKKQEKIEAKFKKDMAKRGF